MLVHCNSITQASSSRHEAAPCPPGRLKAFNAKIQQTAKLVMFCTGSNSDGPGDQKRCYPPGVEDIGSKLLQGPKLILSDADRVRLDENPDSLFYSNPRMMQHAEPEFTEALSSLYRRLLQPAAAVLELCSSCHSHLPPELHLSLLVGQGMNSAELAANKALSQWFVQDLNQQPLLLEQLDDSYDAVLLVNGIQYLTQPEVVLAEVHRVIRPGGFLCLAFGSHCFPEKATAAWLNRGMAQRAHLITSVLEAQGFEVRLLDSILSIQEQLAGAAQQQAPSGGRSDAAGVDLCVILALKKPTATTATSTAMTPSNVAEWFTKPGLMGLDAAAAAAGSGSTPAEQQPSERLMEQWHNAYDVLVSDAVALGVPKSVIPALGRDATPSEVQAAVQHLQGMVASFLSSGL